VTESDELTAALNEASTYWPGESRSALLVRLALAGHLAIHAEHGVRLEQRVSAMLKWRGAFSDIYDPNLLRELREDWTA